MVRILLMRDCERCKGALNGGRKYCPPCAHAVRMERRQKDARLQKERLKAQRARLARYKDQVQERCRVQGCPGVFEPRISGAARRWCSRECQRKVSEAKVRGILIPLRSAEECVIARPEPAKKMPPPVGPLMGCPSCRAYGVDLLGRANHRDWCGRAVTA